jgi:hypothetical protein
LDRDWGKLRIWIVKKRLEGKAVTDICSEAQIDRRCFIAGGIVTKRKDGKV